MWEMLASAYVTLAPVIFAGILNMVWVKTKTFSLLAVHMDGGRFLADGRRIFGDNKTWKGFVGMIVLTAMAGLLWGMILKGRPLEEMNLYYHARPNTPLWSTLSGALSGFGYILFELPNSWLKRRLDIRPGKNPEGSWKVFFVILDQADSVLGCLVILRVFYPFSWGFFLAALIAGAGTHLLLNMLLYALKLRKNMF